LSFDAAARKASVSSAVPSRPVLAAAPSKASLKPTTAISDPPRAPSPNVDAAEQAVLEEAGLKEPEKTPDGKRPIAPNVDENEDHTKDVAAEKEKLEKGKIRRSLHRTLREAHVPTHTRSKKGKDSSSSAGMSDEPATDDVLSRGTGSFVVHGKKASVIQFGSELQSMSPDERLRLRRQSHKEEPGNLSPATIEDDFQSTLAEPADFRERQNSVATTSSATTRSFRELHKRLYPSGLPAIVTSDGEDSEAAISFSEDGRRTPLPPVEDEAEDQDYLSRPGSSNQQAMFYTPEASNSPSQQYFSEKHYAGDHTDESTKAEEERLPTPPAQTTMTA